MWHDGVTAQLKAMEWGCSCAAVTEKESAFTGSIEAHFALDAPEIIAYFAFVIFRNRLILAGVAMVVLEELRKWILRAFYSRSD
jgi:hypothetical protein